VLPTARSHKVESRADRGAVDHRDDRDVQSTQRDVRFGFMAKVEATALDVDAAIGWWRLAIRIARTGHVHAGAESAATARDHEAAHGSVEPRIDQDFPQALQERECQGVEFFGAIQCDPDNPVLLATTLNQEFFR
jgi:hypothetical protein